VLSEWIMGCEMVWFLSPASGLVVLFGVNQ
jgi:hypothetical protein